MEELLPDVIMDQVYDQEDIEYFKQFFGTFPEKKRSPYTFISQTVPTKVASNRFHINVRDDVDVMDRLMDRIPDHIKSKAIVEVGYMLQSFIPYQIHDDMNYMHYRDNESPYYAFIIPLETLDARTILFHQTKTSAQPTSCVDDETHNKYLSHCDRSHTEKLSISNIFEWKVGSVFMFDIRLLHCSDNYLKNGVTEKRCITLMSKCRA